MADLKAANVQIEAPVESDEEGMGGSSSSSSSATKHMPLPDIPAEQPKKLDEATLRTLHMLLFDICVEEATLVCPESGREFPVEKGIPNMLLHDDEI